MPYALQAVANFNVKMPLKMKGQLEDLSHSLGKSKSFIALEAIQNYLLLQSYHQRAIKNAVKKADSPDAKFIEHKKIMKWLKSWGTDAELEPPE